MSETTIPYVDYSFNPWLGCEKVSPGCQNCYAQRIWDRSMLRFHERRRTAASTWRQPLAWDRRAARNGTRYRVLCGSACDVFDREAPDLWRQRLWALIEKTPNLDWLMLTKRPEQLADFWPIHWPGWPPPNVWLGVTAEDEEQWSMRVPLLLSIPAVRRWVSIEPMLEPFELRRYWGRKPDWIVVGGESGPRARPCNIAWIRSVVAQCRAAEVPGYVKQVGSCPVDRNDRGFEGDSGPQGWPMDTDTTDDQEPGTYQGKPVRVILRDRKGADPAEWPEDLRVREVLAMTTEPEAPDPTSAYIDAFARRNS